MLQGNVVFSHSPRESVFQKISNTRQNPLNPVYNADSFQETDHLYFLLMVNQASVPKAETASPVLSGVLKPESFSLKRTFSSLPPPLFWENRITMVSIISIFSLQKPTKSNQSVADILVLLLIPHHPPFMALAILRGRNIVDILVITATGTSPQVQTVTQVQTGCCQK